MAENKRKQSNKKGGAGQELVKELTWKFPQIAKEKPEQKAEAFSYCEKYKEFLDQAKTEREFVSAAEKLLKKAGYLPFEPGKTYRAGQKVYEVNRQKALLMTTFGTEPLEKGVHLNIAHIDSPRLDLKPNPMYEKSDLAYFKTHYYGGIRKYQWATIPLAMHGVVIRKDQTRMDICVGEEEGDPVFCVTDLLPHLAADQNERKLKDGIKGEELNIIIGSLPYEDSEEVKEPVKLLALQLLHEKYGMTEKDFIRAEIEMVPAVKAKDVGLDRSMVGAYGQDDRVCAYAALTAEIDAKAPRFTTLTVLADKEEIGSVGNTGLNSDFVLHFIKYLAQAAKADVKTVLRNSICLSADVNAAYDPTFAQVYEENNACYLGRGCVLTKYTGARGKAGSSDASAETMARMMDIMDQSGVFWQIGELGAVDVGGGGTVACFVAGMNIDVVDLGVPILSMHSPFELASKLDIYNTYKAFWAFNQ